MKLLLFLTQLLLCIVCTYVYAVVDWWMEWDETECTTAAIDKIISQKLKRVVWTTKYTKQERK